MFKPKICPMCNTKFIPQSGKQKYCKREVNKICPICGDSFISYCDPKANITCDKSQCKKSASKFASIAQSKICRICGESFQPKSARQLDCGKLIKRRCAICGTLFDASCSKNDTRQTCDSRSCMIQFAHLQSIASYSNECRKCIICGKEFTPRNNTQKICNNAHYKKCEVCGKEFKIENNTEIRRTCSSECHTKLRFINGNPFNNPISREKAKATLITKYGQDYGKIIWQKSNQTYQQRTGYDHPSHDPRVRKQSAKARKNSKLEQKICDLFNQYHIEYVNHYMLSRNNLHHEFDFYLPKYKILIDADGVYFHGYNSDPDDKKVVDRYDDIRLALVPSDHIFHVIVEGNEERDIKKMVDIISKIDAKVFDYDSEIFKWCRSISFPYPERSIDRMKSDYTSLCKYQSGKYSPHCRIGESLILNFHKSIYSCHVGDAPSPIEGWNDDMILKKVITNRLIYANDIDPSKILRGLYISKLAPRVSIFNPILAKYLVLKYLNKYDTIFDPFSGFSGRLLGTCSLGKKYIGQDLNAIAVSESNQIVSLFNLNANIIQKDILNSQGAYECLFTCPPYNKKEIYNNETIFKSCDDWIDECVSRFKCQHYVFVVDTTEKYKDHIVEELKTSSHLSSFSEFVIYI